MDLSKTSQHTCPEGDYVEENHVCPWLAYVIVTNK
jgi:hypothetical protein